MSGRPGFVVDHFQDADGGVSPNKFHPVISVQMRCNWPPLSTFEETMDALNACYLKAVEELARMRPALVENPTSPE